MKAMVWSITHSFSCYRDLSVSIVLKIKKIVATHMRPVKRAGLEVRWGSLNENVRMQAAQTLLGITGDVRQILSAMCVVV